MPDTEPAPDAELASSFAARLRVALGVEPQSTAPSGAGDAAAVTGPGESAEPGDGADPGEGSDAPES